MRYDESKSFPYPVLREGSEDYLDGAFQATSKCELSEKADAIEVRVNFALGERSIKKLLKEKKVKFALLVDARETYFRDLITTFENSEVKRYTGGKIKGPVTLLAYIFAAKDIKNFRSPNFNAEYSKKSFFIEKGDVLALDLPKELYVGQEVLAHIGTVFELVGGDKLKEGELDINLEEEKVQIRVSPQQKTLLNSARGQTNMKSILYCSIYFPVLMEVLRCMSKDAAEFESKKWYRSIKAKCDLENIDVVDGMDLLAVAQRLLSYPVKTLNEQHFGGEDL